MNVLNKYFIMCSLELIDFLFVATFAIKIKKKMTKVRQTFQISLTDVICTCAIYAVRTASNPHPSPPLSLPHTIFLMAPVINMWPSCSQ